ncbi:MAG: hypothetical protein GXO66_09085 [Euryarchaeota archaeon]|nr:hypothetical protein [Euryarchaeota archaeon]
MRDLKISLLIAVTLIVTLSLGTVSAKVTPAANCTSFTIDGDLSDWGVDLSGDWSLNETWLPNSGISFVVEDNRDPRYGGVTGVHIQGIGSSYTTYYEPKAMHKKGYLVVEPLGGEKWDLEAIYRYYDSNCLYFAVVTSLKPDGKGDLAPGDLALDVDRNASTGKFGYEFGVKLGSATGLSQWEIGYLPDWKEPTIVVGNRPALFKSYLPGGGKVGEAIGVYRDIGITDHGYTNYVIEVAIPLAVLNTTTPAAIKHHLADGCGNDSIKIPEFFTVAIPLAMLFGTVALLHRRRLRF